LGIEQVEPCGGAPGNTTARAIPLLACCARVKLAATSALRTHARSRLLA